MNKRIVCITLIAKGVLLGSLVSAPVFALDVQLLSPAGVMIAQAQQAPAPQTQPTPQERAAMLKQWLQTSQAQLRAYEWIETTIVSKDGEEKSLTQKRCYYGVDGKVQKIPVVTPQPEEKKRGLRGKIAEHKKEEMTEYMQSAVELVHSYIPPVPGLIQQSISAGKLGMQMLDPGRRVRLTFGDYLKPGDSLGVEIELPTNRLLGITVASYLDSAGDPIALNVMMSVLPDGTIYAERTTLDAKAKGLNVSVENTGYRRIAP